MDIISKITLQDAAYIFSKLSPTDKERLSGAKILLTGFAGSIGYMLLNFLAVYGEELGIQKVYALDNYQLGQPPWIKTFEANPLVEIRQIDIVYDDFSFAADADYIMHMASLASPVYYRQYPIQTIDADIIGLRRLLDYYKDRQIRGFLFFSSSEIYGDPPPECLPTKEAYWGNVNSVGPRACYDESKRLGETLCYNFARLYNLPITIVRPFNNYGPGMRLNDLRVTADFAKAIVQQEPIIIYSNGLPTRTYLYISDAVIGYLKCLLWGKFDVFNIGSPEPELSIAQLAELYAQAGEQLFGRRSEICYRTHKDKDYLIDNPNRRCPDIAKAKALLGFAPNISVTEGIERYLQHLKQIGLENAMW